MEAPRERTRRAIEDGRDRLLEVLTSRHFARHPGLYGRYGPAGRSMCIQDAGRHLDHLAEAVGDGEPALFADYVAWAQVVLKSRGLDPEDLADHLRCLGEALRAELPEELARVACAAIDAGLARLAGEGREPVGPHAMAARPLTGLARDYLDALLGGRRHAAATLVLEAVRRGTSVGDIYLDVFLPAQHEIGRLWQVNRVSVAQEHYCTAATQLIMAQLYPHVFAAERKGLRLVACCVAGDLHEIGARMVADFFEMDGWDTFYLGASLPAADVVGALVAHAAHVLAVSATLTPHVGAVAELVARVRAEAACRAVRILVGGPPFNAAPSLWRRVGADGWAPGPRDAIALAHRLLAEGPP